MDLPKGKLNGGSGGGDGLIFYTTVGSTDDVIAKKICNYIHYLHILYLSIGLGFTVL